jgi:hypothetical protein
MPRKAAIRASVLILFLSFFSACNFSVPDKITVTTEGGDRNVSNQKSTCTATPNPSVTQSGVGVAVTIRAQGFPPFSGVGTGTFTESTTISRTYANSTSSQIMLNDEVTILDANNSPVDCTWKVNVLPSGSSGPAVSCVMTANPTSVSLNGYVNYSVTASGGNLPFTFSSFTGGDGAVTTSPFVKTSSTQGAATVQYVTTGYKTGSVTVADAQGNTANCSQLVNVSPLPSISVATSPSSTVSADSLITLTVSTANFLSTPTITYTTTWPTAVINPNGSSATVGVTNNAAQSFSVLVRAVAGNQSAQVSIPVTFSAQVPLVCTLSHMAGVYRVGDTIPFTVSASEPVQLTSVIVPSDAQTVGSVAYSPFYVKFNGAGTKFVTVQARGSVSGRLCNAGAAMQDSVLINNQLMTCSLQTYFNPANAGQTFTAVVTPNYNSGSAYIYSINTDRPAVGNYNVLADRLSATVVIYNSDTYLLSATIKDASGQTATCSTQQIIW